MNAGTPVCRVTARRMDVHAVTPDELKSSGVFLVVDCAGPFQAGSPEPPLQPGYIISTLPMLEILWPASRNSIMTRERQE